MRARATFPRFVALLLSLIMASLALTAVAAGASVDSLKVPVKPAAKLPMVGDAIPANPSTATIAQMVAQKQAEAAAAAEAARIAAEQTAAAQAVAAEEQAAQVVAAEEGDAWSILASFGVPGTSIGYGDANGYEACAYYKSGYIVISPNHSTDLYTLIAHEVNHILEWRSSGQTSD
jgi:hypothetical protein